MDITNRSYTFAKRYIQSHCNSAGMIQVDGIWFDNHSTSTTLIDNDYKNMQYEKYCKHKRIIANKNRFKYVQMLPWDDVSKIQIRKPSIQVSAHDCEIYKLNPSVGRRFVEKYDIYGNSRGQVLFLGLVLKGELVQVMSFKKASSRSKYDVQIASMCTKRDYQIYGGFVKLFRFATEYYELYNIVAYNDLSKFSGEIFEHMNMKLDHINPPQLIWYNEDTGKHIADSVKYLYHKTKEDMINESYLPIYTCGSSVYVYV